MLSRSVDTHDRSIVGNRAEFCNKININYDDVVYQRIVYSKNRSYDLICEVGDGSTTKNTDEVVADALFTKSKYVGLMLPVADCLQQSFMTSGGAFWPCFIWGGIQH